MVTRIIRESISRETFENPVYIRLPYRGKVDSCLFKRHASIIYGELGCVEHCDFEGDVSIKTFEETLENPDDRTFETNIYRGRLNIAGPFTVKNNMRIR